MIYYPINISFIDVFNPPSIDLYIKNNNDNYIFNDVNCWINAKSIQFTKEEKQWLVNHKNITVGSIKDYCINAC